MNSLQTTISGGLIALAHAVPAARGQNPTLTIDVSHPGAMISPNLTVIPFHITTSARPGVVGLPLESVKRGFRDSNQP